jgi:hypothetical protein
MNAVGHDLLKDLFLWAPADRAISAGASR